MNRLFNDSSLVRRVTLACWLLVALPVAAQFPEPDCNPATWPANAPTTATVDNYCAGHPLEACSLRIRSWPAGCLPEDCRSPDIRIGSAIGATTEQPHFLFDSDGHRFYAKLYLQLKNDGLGPAPASQVSVDLAFKEGDSPADPSDATGWNAVGTYGLRIPPAVSSVGALFPSQTHVQHSSRPVCWTLPVGDKELPRKFTLRATVHWTQDDSTTNNTAFSFYDLTLQEKRAQIGFAMDLSGSMAGTRLTQAKQKAAMFAHLIEDGDQLGVYGFATDNPANTTPPSLISYNGSTASVSISDTSVISPIQEVAGLADRVAIANAIALQSAHNCTPVGQGLLRARHDMASMTPPANAQKAIVVFSDGLQNVPPFVNTDPGWSCQSDPAAPIIDAIQTFGAEGIEIYSVFFDEEWAYGFELMDQIQNQTGGDLLFGTATELGLASAYFAIRGLVDDMIFLAEEGTTSSATPAQFEVAFDSGVNLATVAVAWPWDQGATLLAVQCRKAGDSAWLDCGTEKLPAVEDRPGTIAGIAAGTTATGAGDLSFLVFRFLPGPDTTWQFRVVQVRPQQGATPYTTAVFSGVREAQMLPSLDNVGFAAGRPLPFRAELRRDGAPVIGARVDAVVRVPTRSFGTTLRRYAGRFSPPAAGDNRAAAVIGQLQSFLAEDDESEQIYLYRDVAVSLRDDGQGGDGAAGDGVYSGVLPGSETELAGDYQVTLIARLGLPSGRTIQRVAKLSALCNVGPADPGRSTVRTTLTPDPAGRVRLATVTVMPTDRFGNAAFPGSGSKIAVLPTDATLSGDLVDNLDSTFTQTLAFDDADARPRVEVQVGGVSLGTVAVLPAQREVSFHLGVAVPHGVFGNSYDGGSSLGVDYAQRLNPNLTVKVELVRDDFDRKAGGSDDLLNLSAYLQYRTASGPWVPYFETGLGVYDFAGTSALGFAGGVGLQRVLTPRWSFDLNLQGHRVGGSLDLSFSRFRAGAIYKF